VALRAEITTITVLLFRFLLRGSVYFFIPSFPSMDLQYICSYPSFIFFFTGFVSSCSHFLSIYAAHLWKRINNVILSWLKSVSKNVTRRFEIYVANGGAWRISYYSLHVAWGVLLIPFSGDDRMPWGVLRDAHPEYTPLSYLPDVTLSKACLLAVRICIHAVEIRYEVLGCQLLW
jgi:hypothetical protein